MKKYLFVFFMEGPGSGLCYLFLFIEVVPVTQNNQVVLELGICGQKNRSIWILQNYGLSRPWLTWYFCFNIQWRVKTNGTEKRRNLFLILRSVNFCPTKSWRQIGCDSCLILLQIKEKQTWALRHESEIGIVTIRKLVEPDSLPFFYDLCFFVQLFITFKDMLAVLKRSHFIPDTCNDAS